MTWCPEREAHAAALLALPDGGLVAAWFSGQEARSFWILSCGRFFHAVAASLSWRRGYV